MDKMFEEYTFLLMQREWAGAADFISERYCLEDAFLVPVIRRHKSSRYSFQKTVVRLEEELTEGGIRRVEEIHLVEDPCRYDFWSAGPVHYVEEILDDYTLQHYAYEEVICAIKFNSLSKLVAFLQQNEGQVTQVDEDIFCGIPLDGTIIID